MTLSPSMFERQCIDDNTGSLSLHSNVAENNEGTDSGCASANAAAAERNGSKKRTRQQSNNNNYNDSVPSRTKSRANSRVQGSTQNGGTNSSNSSFINDENNSNGAERVFVAVPPSRSSLLKTTTTTKTSSQTKSQAPSSASTVKSQPVFKDVNDLIKFFIHDPELASTLKKLLKCGRTMNNTFAQELRDRYLAILRTTHDADAQTYLNEAHASRDKMAIPINSCVRDKGRHEGERYVANFGMLPLDVAGVIAVLCYYLANYATLECTKYDGNGDDNNRVDVDNNASMNMLRKGLPTMIVNEYNRTLDESTHHLHAVKNDNGEATTVSDINVACLDKGTYPGHYKVDVNMLVILLGLHNVLEVKKRNQATKVGRLIFQLAGLLGLIENVVAKWLVTNFEEQVHIMVCGSNAGALIGTTNNSRITWVKGPHPENWCVNYFSNGNYSDDDLTKIDAILKEWYIRRLRIIDLPNDDNKQAMEEQLNAHVVRVTHRFGNKNLTEEERQQLPSGGKTRRQKAFNDSNSNGCILFYHLGSNATYAIGNNQTTPAFTSSMWGNQAVSRCHFYRLKLSDKVSSNICTLDDGIRLQDELNELLDKLTDQDVAERLDALSEHGVDGYNEPENCYNGRQKAFNDSSSNGCIMLYHLGSNATFAIGNNQTTHTFTSSMWGNQAVSRSQFYQLKLSDKVSSNLCTLEDGIRLQDELNELLDDLTDQDGTARLDALSEHGVVGYEVPKEDTWEKHKRELKSILEDNEGSWVNIETDEGDKKVLLLSTGNHGNSTAALYSYVSKHFLNQPIEYLKGLDEWDDISDFNWHLHKSARDKRDEEEEGGAPKARLDTREKKRQLMRERMKEMEMLK